jgi:hypothetical protein
MGKGTAAKEHSGSGAGDSLNAKDVLLQRLRTSEHVPACPVTGLPYSPTSPTSRSNDASELQSSCHAVSLSSCGCVMSAYAARRMISARKCTLCGEAVLTENGYRNNACMTRAAQVWAADLSPQLLAESDLEVYFDARLRLPPRAVADGTLYRGKMVGTGEALAVLVVPIASALAWERSAVRHALVVAAGAAALTPLMSTVLGACWRENDVLVAFSEQFLVDGASDPKRTSSLHHDVQSLC